MPTIPADLFVDVNPSVLPTGGAGLILNGLLLSNSTRVPIGTVMSFGSPADVQAFFGGTSREALFAGGGVGLGSGYFGGYDNSTIKPGALLVAQYNQSAVSAYLRGGSTAGISLTQLQGFNATLNVTIDGVLKTSSVNLAGATSFTNAAQLIEGDLAISGPTAGTGTATIAVAVMTVSAVLTGGTPFKVGDKITGAGVTAGSFIASFGTGTGGAGTYNLTQTSTVGSPITVTSLLPAVAFDSVTQAFVIQSSTTGASTSSITFGSGAMATDLLLTQALGATISPGADAAVPAPFMTSLVAVTKNWASFATSFDPDGGSGFANKLAFSAWTNSQKNRFVYAAFDTDVTPTTQNPDANSYAAAVTAGGYSGTSINWEPSDQNLCAFVTGAIASVDFDQPNGRIAFAYRKQSGLPAGVMSEQAAINLGGNPQVTGDRGNGYNYYGAIATANQNFVDYQRGFVSGPFLWLDTYVNQIAMNSDFQLALMDLQEQANSIPFTAAGDAMVEAALSDTIDKYLAFGAIVPGVVLSSTQAALVKAAAGGKDIASTITAQGWYLFLKPSSAQVRQGRGPKQITFFYADGESVQSFSLSSVVVL